jgi:hypothetical protein
VDPVVTEEQEAIQKAEQLKQEGNQQYALDQFEAAAELYWQVSPPLHAELNLILEALDCDLARLLTISRLLTSAQTQPGNVQFTTQI